MATALVIEDDDDIRGLLEVILEQAGYAVTATATGAAGMEALAMQEPGRLLGEVGLPCFDGYGLVRQERSGSRVHIVMPSARSQESDARRGLAAGADEYLTKPFRPRELREQLAEIVARPVGSIERRALERESDTSPVH